MELESCVRKPSPKGGGFLFEGNGETKTIGEFCLEMVYDTLYDGREIQIKMHEDGRPGVPF